MSAYIPLLLFLSLYIGSVSIDRMPKNKRGKILLILFFVFVCVIGFRDPNSWIDTTLYAESFEKTTKTLVSFSFNDEYMGYSEKGYYLLCVIAKTISSSLLFYFTFIGGLSMIFLFSSLRRYSIYPVLGLCIYIARYMLARDMNQMRAGLAISIIISFSYLLVSKNRKDELKYALICWLVSFIHTSMLTAIPILLFNHFFVSKKKIYIGIAISFFVSAVFSQQIISFISQSSLIQEMATEYVNKESSKAYAADLTNPMIYYQCIILFIYTFMEKQLAPMSKYYYVFRNGYFMSTVILIVLCQYAVLSARVSTIFATFEIFMIPMIIVGLPKSYRMVAYLALLAPLVVFFNYNMC